MSAAGCCWSLRKMVRIPRDCDGQVVLKVEAFSSCKEVDRCVVTANIDAETLGYNLCLEWSRPDDQTVHPTAELHFDNLIPISVAGDGVQVGGGNIQRLLPSTRNIAIRSVTSTFCRTWAVQRGRIPGTEGSASHPLLIACTALRANRSGSVAAAKRCCEMRPPVARCFDAHSQHCIQPFPSASLANEAGQRRSLNSLWMQFWTWMTLQFSISPWGRAQVVPALERRLKSAWHWYPERPCPDDTVLGAAGASRFNSVW